MCAIKPPRNPDHEAFGICGIDAAHQRIDLNVECLVTIFVQLVRTIGDERKAPDGALKPFIPSPRTMLEGNTSIPVLGPTCGLGGIVERLHPHALGQDALSINIRDAKFGIEIEANTFDEQVAEFVDHPLPVPREIGRAFSVSAGRIGVSAHQAA